MLPTHSYVNRYCPPRRAGVPRSAGVARSERHRLRVGLLICASGASILLCGEQLRRRRRMVRYCLHIALLIVLVPSLMAQTAGTGALTGRIMDASGAVLPGVMVTATSLDTGQSRSALTSENGTYSLTLLPPGNYRVQFELLGFTTLEVPSVKVNVTETAVLDRTL